MRPPARRRHLLAPAPGCCLAVACSTLLFSAFCRLPGAHQTEALETETLRYRAAHLGKNQPTNASCDEHGSNRVVAGLLCQDRQDVFAPGTRIDAAQQVADNCRRRDVVTQIVDAAGE